MKKILFILICTLFFCSCNDKESEQQSDCNKNKTGSIHGSAIIINTGNSVKAFAQLLDNKTQKPTGDQDITGEKGLYRFDNVPVGEYCLKITKRGYTDRVLKDTVISINTCDDKEVSWLIQKLPPTLPIIDVSINTYIDTLAFGSFENYKAFLIENDSDNPIEWTIDKEYVLQNCQWITEIEPSSGTLKVNNYNNNDYYGQVIVTIDRNKFDKVNNATNIIIIGGGGKDLKITATGEAKPALATLTTSEVQTNDITNTTAVLCGNMTSEGNPRYTQRGFEVSTTSDFANIISIVKENPISSSADFSATVSGLSCGNRYYVRAYATNSEGKTYGSERTLEYFDTKKILPKVSTNMEFIEDLIAYATVETPYIEKGFCWAANPAYPSLKNKIKVEDNAIGNFNAKIPCENLTLENCYSVWAYAINDCDTTYSKKMLLCPELPLFVHNEPLVYEVGGNYAKVEDDLWREGVPNCFEKGFLCYDEIFNLVKTIKVEGYDSNGKTFRGTITELQRGKTYKVKSYAKNCIGTAYSSKFYTFTTD